MGAEIKIEIAPRSSEEGHPWKESGPHTLEGARQVQRSYERKGLDAKIRRRADDTYRVKYRSKAHTGRPRRVVVTDRV